MKETKAQCARAISYLSALKETLSINKNGGGRHRLDQSEHTLLYENDTKEIKKRPMETTYRQSSVKKSPSKNISGKYLTHTGPTVSMIAHYKNESVCLNSSKVENK